MRVSEGLSANQMLAAGFEPTKLTPRELVIGL